MRFMSGYMSFHCPCLIVDWRYISIFGYVGGWGLGVGCVCVDGGVGGGGSGVFF